MSISDGRLIGQWQRSLRDDLAVNDIDLKVGFIMSTLADQYTDPSKGYQAGWHIRPVSKEHGDKGTRMIARLARVAERNVAPSIRRLTALGYLEKTFDYRQKSGWVNEHRLVFRWLAGQCPTEAQENTSEYRDVRRTHRGTSDGRTDNTAESPTNAPRNVTGDVPEVGSWGLAPEELVNSCDDAPAAKPRPRCDAADQERTEKLESRRVVRRPATSSVGPLE